MATFTVNLNMDSRTVNDLLRGGFSLYGFKAVATSVGGGAPLVWFKTKDYSTSTVIQYEQEYVAYTSKSALIPGGDVKASDTVDIDLNQTFVVDSAAGTGTVASGGVASAISVRNNSNPATEFTTGIGQKMDGSTNILCGFPLFPGFLDVIAPIEIVVFTFASNQVDTGSVIFQAFGPSAEIDLTGAPSNTRNVSFNITSGWQSEPFVNTFAAGTDLVPFLIKSDNSSVRSLLAA